jgi:hypothetical protein
MPEISRFLGIVIGMFYRDHDPPHFHASYGDYAITVEIRTGAVNGQFPRRALRLVQEWRKSRQQELLDDWRLARERRALAPIQPLE